MSTTTADRVRKLLALAKNNPNVNEAAAAFARAQEIAARHAIDLDTVSVDEPDAPPPAVEGIRKRTIETMGRVVWWKIDLLDQIAKANRCKIFYCPGAYIAAYGQPSDLDTVQYMYHAIRREIDRLAKTAAKGMGRSWGRNFRIGAVDEIGQRLRQARQRAINSARQDAFKAGGETALVRVDQALEHAERIEAAVQDFHDNVLKLRSGGGSFRGAGSYGYGEGRAAGRTVTLGGGHAVGTGPKALK